MGYFLDYELHTPCSACGSVDCAGCWNAPPSNPVDDIAALFTPDMRESTRRVAVINSREQTRLLAEFDACEAMLAPFRALCVTEPRRGTL